jgi:hypothetical protein
MAIGWLDGEFQWNPGCSRETQVCCVGHVVILLRFCAFRLESGVLWEYSSGLEAIFPWGCKPNSMGHCPNFGERQVGH